jgi:hypothetical protein
MNWNNQWEAQPLAPVIKSAKLDEPLSEDLKARLKNASLPETPDGVLMLWVHSKKILETAKSDEMEIRKTAVKIYVPKPSEGMNTVELGNGFKLKAQVSYNYNLDPDNAKVEAALDAIAALGNEGPFIAERLVKWTPDFLLTEYRLLQDDVQNKDSARHEFSKKVLKILESVLTLTDAAPKLEIKEAKKK